MLVYLLSEDLCYNTYNLSSVSQNVLKFYQQLTGEERTLSFLVGTISNVLVMEIGWTDVGSGGYILVSKLLKKFQNILRNTTQVIIRHSAKILFSVISSPITLERQK
jgi:hypothetical protein